MFPCPLAVVFEPSGAVGAEEDREEGCGHWALLRALCCPGSIPSISAMGLEVQLEHGAVRTCRGCSALVVFHWETGVTLTSIFLLKWN